MLRIIHTGRAYEVMDLLPTTYCFPDNRGLHMLRDKYAALRLHYWQQTELLGKTCREVWCLKELLENTEQELGARTHTLDRLRDMYATARDCYWQQDDLLERASRTIKHLKELLESTERWL